uniref:Malate dehydrogenase (Oxaloacetate-decarboxylating) n=1 Tax=Solibacter usitatus (strain Ellin6076) TaxID=234267 RepID=Q023A8_SOLUE
MRQSVIPIFVPVTKPRPLECRSYQTKCRGVAVLNSPMLNKGTAFTSKERKELGLTGLLPPEISTLGTQVKLAYIQYDRLPDTLAKNTYLTTLHAHNEVLFYRLFSEHLREMIPVLDDATLSLAAQRNHHECGQSRGVYLSIDHIDAMEEAFANLGADAGDIDLILTTDGEQVRGVGDAGMSGIERSLGKLAVYTAAGGINPNRAISVVLDVGTDRQDLLDDPTYIGNRHPRIRGKRYDAFLESYVTTTTRLFPHAMLHWENFAPGNGRRLLEKYGGQVCTFNDDMQGTGAITLAAAISAVRICGTPLRNQRVVILGAGTAGVGIADQICDAMAREGLSRQEAVRQFWFVDRQGLLTSNMTGQLRDHQVTFARPDVESRGWKQLHGGGIGLAEVVRQVKPTMLIGASSSSGSFTEPIIRQMAAHTARPIIFVLSTPPVRAEANPADLIAWTAGRALIATGSLFAPVTYRGLTYVVAQLNNAMVYPGLSLGAVVARARRISEGMFEAAAGAVSSLVTVRHPGASLLPHIDDLSSVSMTVAAAVAEAAVSEGLSRAPIDDIVQQVRDAMWQPEYHEIQAS